MSIARPIGTETEFGILSPSTPGANAMVLSSHAVSAYYPSARSGGEGASVSWDYVGEDPLADLRGYRMDRASADPSMLTDDPLNPAPSGPGSRTERVARPSREQRRLPQAASCMLANGARYYVDHAHPEYSGPECATPLEAVLYDRAGEVIARRAMAALAQRGETIVLYKNNVDGKGASYGAHENYLLRRDVDFKELSRLLIPFFVTRPLICGAGRVGLGQSSENPGFQISQRADYVENTVGLETTFNRPIVNTRDEPHAHAGRWRRLHVIGGDANQFDVSTYLRLASTSAVLWFAENGDMAALHDVSLAGDPVVETWNVSHDPTLAYEVATEGAGTLRAVDIQRRYADVISQAMDRAGAIDADTREFFDRWTGILDTLATHPMEAAKQVEWVAKYQLLDAMRQRLASGWEHSKLQAMDLQWADLRTETSLVTSLDAAGRIERLFTSYEVDQAADTPPAATRAFLRGGAVRRMPELAQASWGSLLFDLGGEDLVRVSLPDPNVAPTAAQRQAIDEGDAQALVTALTTASAR
ncbi:MAG: depupylase/deamidase Dop [Actinomycetaceae bacterium]|nr:depupylase/deamidase Dop [Actinomycetaceae bacterium]MDU0969566.1 depupylase/deamidase Dop [Actinomycetaceae bacterium]